MIKVKSAHIIKVALMFFFCLVLICMAAKSGIRH